MAGMNSKERVLAALRREDVDYVPCCVSFNPLSPVQRRGREWTFPWAVDASVGERLAIQVGELGLDQVIATYADLCRPAPGVKARVRLEGDVLHKSYETPAGELHAAIRYNDLWPLGEDIPFHNDFNVGHFVEPWIQNESDLACFMEVERLCDTDAVLAEARAGVMEAKQIADRYGLATIAHVGRGLTGALAVFGAADLCTMVIDNPELVDAYLEHDHKANVRMLEVLGELGVDIVRRNGFYETADFYGPDMLERFLGDRLRKEAEVARAGGMLTSYTVHTGVMPILDYLAGLSMDSLFGIDIEFDGVVPERIRDRLAPTTSFWTGPSSTYHLWKGPEPTRAAVRQVFDVFGKRGLILSPCVSAHSIMPWESTLAMVDEWKRLR